MNKVTATSPCVIKQAGVASVASGIITQGEPRPSPPGVEREKTRLKMKTAGKFHGQGLVSGLQLCSASGVIECGGELFAPDAATAYVEFFLSHTVTGR